MTMNTSQIGLQTPRKPIRLWPGVVAAVLLASVWLGLPLVVPGTGGTAILGGLVGAVFVFLWWVFFSRALWLERVGVLALMAVALMATSRVVHPSIANGMMGMMLFVFGIPLLGLALVGSLVAGRHFADGPRRALVVAGIVLACGGLTLVRTAGVTGDGESDLHWRWTITPEERLLAQAGEDRLGPAPAAPTAPLPAPIPAPAPSGVPEQPPTSRADEPVAPPETPATAAPETPLRAAKSDAVWPGFRGPHRDSVIAGVRIDADWSASPPVELWRRPIGPGWSSFAVSGELVYTQEQRGDDEIVSAYRLATGEPVWQHADPVRFWESNAGAGPRATPTVADGRVYTLGATGLLNALDAGTGAVVWSRDAAAEAGAAVPGWGFAGSPLATGDLVIISLSGQLVAYDAGTGQPRWSGAPSVEGYSSPHLLTIDGVEQILLLRGALTTSVAPADGTVLWEHSWPAGASFVQPALVGQRDVLITAGDAMGGVGMRRIAVAHGPGGWTTEERWTSRGLKPYFNDFVVHEGLAFGFDGSILACIDLADGTRKWKGGRYGHGQLVLLPDEDLLLVLSEEGELALVGATPDQFSERARFKAIEGKTWNHPALAVDILLVRNGEEMAAFRLPLAHR